MKRILISLAALTLAVAAFAQTTPEEYLDKYTRLTNRLGYAGVGIETFIDKWEAAYPQDGMMLEARCNYYLEKAMTNQVVPKDQDKFLGNKPILSIPDSTGKNVNYFQETFFDDELFGQAISYINKAIEYHPLDLVYRRDLITCLLAYEKESPDMAVTEIEKLIQQEKTEHPAWLVKGAPIEEGEFSDLMLSFCIDLWGIGTPAAYEAFFTTSSKLTKLYPKSPVFIDNLGSYWLVARGNDVRAMKYYKKALKLDPDDEVAKTNIKIIERRRAQKKH